MNQVERPRQEAGQPGNPVRPPTEREVLRVLWAGGGEHLVRSQIHKSMPRIHRPTLGRVGQILAELYKDDLLVRKIQRAQGARKAGFYALSERGKELCRRLGFEREEKLLFQVSGQTLDTCLTRDRLARRPEPPGRIVAVYGYSGGLGRSTLVAHVAKGLAEKLSDGEELLAVDLDLESSGLDAFLPLEDLKSCRGFGGLMVDFERQAPRKRALWLLSALSNQKYAVRPAALPGLVYMPSGLSPGQNALSPSERTETLAMLHAEAGLVAPTGRRDPGLKSLNFLSELRSALLKKFAWTVLDPQAGRSLGAWVATQALADELILCARVTDSAPATIAGLRAVLACFLHKRTLPGPGGGVTFLFRLTETWNREDLDRWIDSHLVMEGAEPSKDISYQAEQLPYDVLIAEPRQQWANTHSYNHLIARLDPGSTAAPPPQLQALSAVLDPRKDDDDRSLAAGILENAPCQELARWVEWYDRTYPLPANTDSLGEKLIRGVFQVQSERLLSRILGSQDGRRHLVQQGQD